MGNWNRRYMPRKKHRHYDYEDPPPAYDSYSSGVAADNRVPSWEIGYCHSAKVPWKKVLASKKYIYAYPSVLNWDGSAGKEALENAKKRFWAKTNGLPYDNPLPDPDMYIDEIDWNPHIDHELMADLDSQACNLDEVDNAEKLESINEEVERAQAQHDKNQYSSDNPWEKDHAQGIGSLKEEKGWGRWNNTLDLKNDDPWEQSCEKLNGSSKDNAWRSENESWGWPQEINNARPSSYVDHGYGKSWNCNEKTAVVRQDGWGWGQGQEQEEREQKSWGWKPGNIPNAEGMTSFRNNNLIGSKDRGWRDNRNVSWGVQDAEYRGNEAKHWDPHFRSGGMSSRGGGRKRESSAQYTSKYKSSRYTGDSYRNGYQL